MSESRFVCAFLALFWLLPCASARGQRIDTGQKKGAPLVFNGKTLFRLYTPLPPLQPEERASVIAGRIQQLASDPAYQPAPLTVTTTGDTLDLFAGEVNLVTITPAEARAAGRPQAALAREYADTIQQAIERFRNERSAKSILQGTAFCLLALGLLALGWVLMGRAVHKLRSHLLRIREQSRTSTTAHTHMMGALAGGMEELLAYGAAAAKATATVVCLLFILGQFPWTQAVADTALSYLFGNIGTALTAFLRNVPDLLFIAILLFLTAGVLRLVRFFFKGVEQGTFRAAFLDPELAPPTYRIVRILVILLAVVAAFPYIPGSRSPAFQGLSVFVGALFTLGSSSLVGNIIAGIVLTYMRPFRLGDRVRIGNTVGDVMEKTGLVTRLRTPRNEQVTFPNSLIMSAEVINYSAAARREGLILSTSVTLGYDVPWRQAHALLIEAALASTHILAEPGPFVLQTSLNDYHITYELNAYTDNAQAMTRTYSQLHLNIQDHFNAAGVEIMSPQYNSLRDGNAITLPPESRPDGYEPPAFRVRSER